MFLKTHAIAARVWRTISVTVTFGHRSYSTTTTVAPRFVNVGTKLQLSSLVPAAPIPAVDIDEHRSARLVCRVDVHRFSRRAAVGNVEPDFAVSRTLRACSALRLESCGYSGTDSRGLY